MKKQNLLTATESARLIGISRQWFYKIRDEYGLNPVKYGNMVLLYPLGEVERVKRQYGKRHAR